MKVVTHTSPRKTKGENDNFHFNAHMAGRITFEIHYEEGSLSEVFMEACTRVSQATKASAAEESELEGIEAAYNVTGVRHKKLMTD